jgi:hypothetical protein
MSIIPRTVPSKKLAQALLSTDLSLVLNNIVDWDGGDLASGDFGTQLFVSLTNDTKTKLEIIEIDPATIANSSITILKRGLGFDGQQTEITANKLDWAANETTVQLGADIPQLFNNYVDFGQDQTIGGIKTFTSYPLGPAASPTTAQQLATKAYVDLVGTGTATYDQQIYTGVAGETLAAGDAVYFKTSDQRWWKTDASAEATSIGVVIGFAQAAAIAGGGINILLAGIEKNLTGLTPGSKYYLSDTPGAVASSAGTNTRGVGTAESATVLITELLAIPDTATPSIHITAHDALLTAVMAQKNSALELIPKSGVYDGFKSEKFGNWHSSLLAADAASGQKTIQLDGVSKLLAGQNVVVFDDNANEVAIVDTVSTVASTPAFDNATNLAAGSGSVGNHTVGASLANTIAVFTAGNLNGTSNITGVTYGGVAMTLAVQATPVSRTVTVYYLVGPPAGSQPIVITGGNGDTRSNIATYSGVSQASPLDFTNSKGSTGTTVTFSETSTLDNVLMIMVGASGGDPNGDTNGAVVLADFGSVRMNRNIKGAAGAGQITGMTQVAGAGNGDWCVAGFNSALTASQIAVRVNLTNSYATADNAGVKRSTSELTIADGAFDFEAASVISTTSQNFYTRTKQFLNTKTTARIFVARPRATADATDVLGTGVTATQNVFVLDSAVAVSATTLDIVGDETGQIADGDTFDLYDSDSGVRERKTVNGTPSFGGGVTTIIFNEAVVAAAGFAAGDFVEHVQALPEISAVSADADESFQTPTYVGTRVDFDGNISEDEYSINLSGGGGVDLVTRVTLTRTDTANAVPIFWVITTTL